MTRTPAERKSDFQSLLVFPGITEEPQWRPMPLPTKPPPTHQEDRYEEDAERWDGCE